MFARQRRTKCGALYALGGGAGVASAIRDGTLGGYEVGGVARPRPPTLPQHVIAPSAFKPQLNLERPLTALNAPAGGDAAPTMSSPQQTTVPLVRTPQL